MPENKAPELLVSVITENHSAPADAPPSLNGMDYEIADPRTLSTSAYVQNHLKDMLTPPDDQAAATNDPMTGVQQPDDEEDESSTTDNSDSGNFSGSEEDDDIDVEFVQYVSICSSALPMGRIYRVLDRGHITDVCTTVHLFPRQRVFLRDR